MGCFAKPYEGNEPYIFVSYCRENSDTVYPIIEQMATAGFRIWYDNGLHPGDNWPTVIAEHIVKSTVFLAFLSQGAFSSHNCRNELTLAIDENLKLVPVMLEDFPLDLGWKLQLSSAQRINKYEYDDIAFFEKLFSSSNMKSCQSECTNQPISHVPTINAEELLREGKQFLKEHNWAEAAKLFDQVCTAEPQNGSVYLCMFLTENHNADIKEWVEKVTVATKTAKQDKQAACQPDTEHIDAIVRKYEPLGIMEPQKIRQEYDFAIYYQSELASRKRQKEEFCSLLESNQNMVLARQYCDNSAKSDLEGAISELLSAFDNRIRRSNEDDKENKARIVESYKEHIKKTDEKINKLHNGDGTVVEKKTKETSNDDGEVDGGTIPKPIDGLLLQEMPTAILIYHKDKKTFHLSKYTSIGRIKGDIIIEEPTISASHAVIHWNSGKFFIRDTDSKNGTSLNYGEQIEQMQPVALHSSDVITLSDRDFLFATGSYAKWLLDNKAFCKLHCFETGEDRILTDTPLLIGRSAPWKFGAFTDKQTSHIHGKITFDKNGFVLTAGESLNGTYLNGRLLEKGEECLLQNGDEVRLGQDIYHLVFEQIPFTEEES